MGSSIEYEPNIAHIWWDRLGQDCLRDSHIDYRALRELRDALYCGPVLASMCYWGLPLHLGIKATLPLGFRQLSRERGCSCTAGFG